jgi:CheY-like chemotaxis protein
MTSSCWTSGCPTATASTRWPTSARWTPAHLPEVIIISGHGTIEAAVRATKLGAYDFLEKPLSLDRTLIVLKNAISARQLRVDNQEFAPVRLPLLRHRRQRPHEGPAPADQADGPHQRPRAHLRRIWHGKELIGRAMHAESLRKDRVFVELNCAAIPEDHIETELFGYRTRCHARRLNAGQRRAQPKNAGHSSAPMAVPSSWTRLAT